MTNLFLDTNIVIDLLNKREPFCFDAVRLFSLAYYKRVRLFVSPMTYATASYLLSKHGAKGVRKHLSDLRRLTEVSPTDENTVDDALASQFEDFEDALQYYSAVQAKAEAIITRNGKDFTNAKLPVMTAGEYLANISQII